MFRARYGICFVGLLAGIVAGLPVLADSRLPASLVRVPESTTTVFVAETSSNRLFRFDRIDGAMEESGNYYISIGQNGPGKQRSGDRRTPLGVYFVTEQLDTSRLHEKYGVTAFPLDYPNAWDRLAARDGDGIWVHGVLPGGVRRPERDTDGCIALPNEDLGQLAPLFQDNITPVVVTETVSWVGNAENLGLADELEKRIATWAVSQQDGDLFTWLSLYSDDFERWGLSRPKWAALQIEKRSSSGEEHIAISDLLLLAYPEEPGLYLSRFVTEVSSGGTTTKTRTRLYWRRGSDGEFRIVAESNG